MKRIFYSLLFLMPFASIAQTTPAPTDTSWKKGGILAVNFTQASFSNWAAGGINSVAGVALVNIFANYNNGDYTWDNNLDMAFGLLQQGKASQLRKTDDKFDFTTKWGKKAFSNKWYYTALGNFRTQFIEGFNYISDTSKVKISNLFAPAYGLIALGLDYKPNDKWSLFIAPATYRATIVRDKALSDIGAFGVDIGENIRHELGGYLRFLYRADIMKNVNMAYRLELFSNYLDRPENIDINTEVLFTFKINKYISATLNMQAIYDNDIKAPGLNGPRLQFRQVLGLGFSTKF
jgi:hypothetical protein